MTNTKAPAALRADAAVLEKMTETFDALLKEATQARDETDAAGTEAKDNPAGEGREKHLYNDFDKPITREDIKTLRTMFPKRKSVNAFTRHELEATAKWAYKYYRQMGVKSPFFRAWFGDWRAQDKNDVKMIDAK